MTGRPNIWSRQWRVTAEVYPGEWRTRLVTQDEVQARARLAELRAEGVDARLAFRDWPAPPPWEGIADA